MKLKSFLVTALVTTFLFSCSKDNDDNNEPLGDYDNGVLVLNQGTMGNSNASVSFIPEDFSAIENDIFAATNSTVLGDVAQSIGFNENEAWIVVNNSGKIEVVDRHSFESITTISAYLESPRYVTFANGKAYITDWGDPEAGFDDYIAIINLENYTMEDYVLVSEGPEQIVAQNGKLYVSHKGGYHNNHIISVIDGTSVTEIPVHDIPDEMFFDEQGDLWVLSEGIFDWSGGGGDTVGAISEIDTETNEVVQTFEFEMPHHPSLMTYEDGMIYYELNNEIYEMPIDSNTLPTEAIISGDFYGMDVENGYLYATDAGNFDGAGELIIFDLDTNTEVTSFTTGVAPAGVYFN